MSVVFLFIDGVGLGDSKKTNPFADDRFRGFSAMAGGQPFVKEADEINSTNHLFKPVDATLGVDGLPQSGTGQATLFSGENAAQEIGKHFGPYPHSGIKHLLRKPSLFQKAQQLQKSCNFINAYPDAFFEYAQKKNRWTCTTLMTKSAGLPLNRVEDVKEGRALTAELTQQAWREQLQIDVTEKTPEEAALVIINQSVNNDLVLHEYYLTDKAGHSQEMGKARQFIGNYDRFLWFIICNKPKEVTIVLYSDHGNVEDLSTKTHTFNKVPLFCLGPGADYFTEVESIQGVTPGIINYFRNKV